MSRPTTRWNRPPGASIFEPGSASESRLLGKGCSAYRSGSGSTRALQIPAIKTNISSGKIREIYELYMKFSNQN